MDVDAYSNLLQSIYNMRSLAGAIPAVLESEQVEARRRRRDGSPHITGIRIRNIRYFPHSKH